LKNDFHSSLYLNKKHLKVFQVLVLIAPTLAAEDITETNDTAKNAPKIPLLFIFPH
jgi:hypothetical protein